MTDDLDKAFRRARRNPGRIFVIGAHGIIWTSTCVDRPIYEPIPSREEICDMDHADILKEYQNKIAAGGKVDNLVRDTAGDIGCHWKTVYNAIATTLSSS